MTNRNRDLDEFKLDPSMGPKEIFDYYEKKIYDLKQLIEISKGLNSTLDCNILIDSILLTCMGQMQLTRAGIFLQKEIDPDIFMLHRNYKGFELDHTMEYEIQANSTLIHYLESDFNCHTMDELSNYFRNDPSIVTLTKVSPTLVVPLKGKEKLISHSKLNGIIILGGRINVDLFSDEEKDYLMHMSSLAGIAIHNAHLYEMATTDMMTKLKLHHYFQAALAEEMEKSARQKTPLSLIMIDIDHFKVFNNKFGHSCGDYVLKKVCGIIIDNIRQIDIAARYGGEEFIIILPETEIHAAKIVGERIRKCIENIEIEYDGNSMSVKVSAGITQLHPKADIDNKTIIQRVDQALYKAKESGRNRIEIIP